MQRVLAIVFVLGIVGSSTFAQTFKLGAKPTPKDIAATLPAAHTGPQKFGTSRSVDLSPFFPGPGNQGQVNSCVAWASAYAMKSYQEQVERSSDPFSKTSLVFSPSFIYNQINGGRDEGSTLNDAGAILTKFGAVTLDIMPYTTNIKQQPTKQQFTLASQYRADGFEMLSPSNISAMKTYLQKGVPIVIGLTVYENFMNYKGGVFKVTSGDEIGGHAMCVLGYDDDKQALKLINSWGTTWGEKGYCWIDYETFKRINGAAMIVRDIQDTTPSNPVTPSNVQASAGSYKDKIQVTWEGVAGTEFYEVYRSLKPSSDFSKLNEVRGTTFIDKGVESGTMYYYAVKANIKGQTSEFSSSAQGFLQTQPGLGVVTGIETSVAQKGVRLVWNEMQGALGYKIYRFIDEQNGFGNIGTSKDNGFEDPSVINKPGVYYYMVTAFNDKREGPNSTSVSVVVEQPSVNQETVALVSPRQLVASQGSFKSKVDLTWEAVKGITQYVVLRYDEAKEVWKILATVKSTKYTDDKPLESKAFYAVVSRIDDVISSIDGFTEGYTSKVTIKKKSFADDTYFSKTDQKELDLKKDTKFANDKFFADPKDFFSDIRPQDFFYIDEAKFFAVDPDFFKIPDGFFDLPPGFDEDFK